MATISYLHLDQIKTDHHLMRILPQEVAYRYHALPVATDGNRITVAMASPEDNIASDAVISAINAPICLVQADPQEIDQHLDNLWLKNTAPRLRFLRWVSPTTENEIDERYAQSLADPFDADLIQVNIPWRGVKSFLELSVVIEQIRPDLIIFPIHHPSWLKRVLLDTSTQIFIDQIETSVIIPRNPRWPLEKILLPLPDGDTEDELAIRWTVQFARSSQSSVTVLPLLPPVLGWYGSFIQHSIQALFTAQDPLGAKMRLIKQRFSEEEIKGTFKLREGEPLNQLSDELQTFDPDLIIIPSSPHGYLRHWMTGDFVNSLMAWVNRPILISKENKSNSSA